MAAAAAASRAAAGSGARPRLVCTITPVALSTRRSDGRSAASRCSRAAASTSTSVARAQGVARGGDGRARGGHGEGMGRVEPRRELLDRGEVPQAGGAGGRVPRFHSPSSRFQIGASALMRSMISRAPANASPRWGADAATATDGSESGTTPMRCSATAAHSPWRSIASATIARDALVGHLHVGLVVEVVDVAGHALEGDDGAGARVAHARNQGVEGQRLGGDDRGHGLAARHRRDERELVARAQLGVGVGVVAVDGHHERQAAGEVVEPVQRVAHARALGQVELDLAGAGALAQHREQSDGHHHARQGYAQSVSTRLPTARRASIARRASAPRSSG